MKIALAQLNPTVGDIEGNRRRILDAYSKAAAMGADLVVTPELSLVGYPPRDLLLKPRFVADNLAAFERLVGEVGRAGLLVGFVDRPVGTHGLPLHNAAALVAEGASSPRSTRPFCRCTTSSMNSGTSSRGGEPTSSNSPA